MHCRLSIFIGMLRLSAAFFPGTSLRRLFYPFRRENKSNTAMSVFTTSSDNNINNSSLVNDASLFSSLSPPIARRDENRVVYIGEAPPGWDPEFPRQAEVEEDDDSQKQEPLVSPPFQLSDPYGWMRDETRTDPEVLEHLQAENEYTNARTAHLDSLRKDLYADFLSRIQETSYSVPRFLPRNVASTRLHEQDWMYYTRMFEGRAYEVYCRAPRTETSDTQHMDWDGKPDSPILPNEQVLLDVNVLAHDEEYCVVEEVEMSPSQQLFGYSVDFTGGERYALRILDLKTGELIEDGSICNNTDGSIVWGKDDDTYYYTKLDSALRPYQVYRRSISEKGTQEADELIYEEHDEMFWLGISKTSDDRYLLISSESSETSEVHFLDLVEAQLKLQDANRNQSLTPSLRCVAKRRRKVLYNVDHRHGIWWISSNVGKLPNMALFTSPAIANCEASWKLVPGNGAGDPLFDGSVHHRSLDDVACFEAGVVISGREDGLPRLWFLRLDEQSDLPETCTGAVTLAAVERLEFEEEAFDLGLSTNLDFNAESILIAYDSFVTPTQHININFADTRQRTLVKERSVPGYDKSLYGSKRILAPSRDGKTEIPVDIVYRKSVMEKLEESGAPAPVHLYAYGAYGACEEAAFSSTVLPLLDRGVIYVVLHIRGGGEMGRGWYEEPNGGKYLSKKNTFNDFVDVAKWLIEDIQLAHPNMLSCEGRSAGGLTVGAAINLAPELFRVAIMGVPFVDVLATMADSRLNLVQTEWEEWGNPNEIKYFQYMKDYSPMENVKPGVEYPAILITAGLHDPRVMFWEPAKFASSLRHGAATNNDRPICLKMEMKAGHFSASDRYNYLRELAFDYAFLLDHLGVSASSQSSQL